MAYVPGATFFRADQEATHARVDCSAATDEGIRQGVRRWGDLLRQAL